MGDFWAANRGSVSIVGYEGEKKQTENAGSS